MTDRQNDARETLTSLARSRAETLRGGTEAGTWDSLHQHQLAAAMRLAGASPDEWAALVQVESSAEAERWAARLIQEAEATAERARENRRNW